MGLLDFIKPKSALEKAAAQVREPYAQPEYRRGAMDKLFEIGTDEAYRALLKRFTISAHGQIADADPNLSMHRPERRRSSGGQAPSGARLP